jgi:TM2 domain-containing membrane protein YozV
MAIDLKLTKWIKDHRFKYTRTQIIDKLKTEGNPEQDIIDSYEQVVKGATTETVGRIITEHKSTATAVILSIFFPGAGHIYLGEKGTGLLILILYGIGYLISLTLIGAVIGVPLIIAMWLWGLIGSIKKGDEIDRKRF